VAPNVVLVGTAVSLACFPAELASQYADFMAYIDAGADPSCWCLPYHCDGDADGAVQGFQKYRVMTNDLTLVSNNWKKKIDTADPCADVDHKAQGFQKYRVMTNDLDVLILNWKKKDGDLAGDCPRP
jgi:hypothetical protein